MKCNATLYLADEYGDNEGKYRCQLENGHTGPHKEEFAHSGVNKKIGKVIVTWEEDEGESFYVDEICYSDQIKSECKRLDGLTQSERESEIDSDDSEKALKCASCELFTKCEDRVEKDGSSLLKSK